MRTALEVCTIVTFNFLTFLKNNCRKIYICPNLQGEQNSERVGTVAEVGFCADEEDMADEYVMA